MYLRLAKKMKNNSLFKFVDERGDTIVEVMVSMSILALVLGTAYASSSRSLQTGTAAAQRNEALSYAQSQLEYIANAQYTDPAKLIIYKSMTTPFCTLPDGGVFQGTQATTVCTNYDSKGYTVFVTFDSAMQVFNVDVKWSGANLASQQSNLKLHYKLPGGFALRPTVSTGSPNSITASSMTLTGTVNPNGSNVTSCSFSYGTTTAYGSSAACSPSPGSGTTPVNITANISGLAAGTLYHIRLCATNGAGTTCDTNDVTASTSVSPPPMPPPPPPPPGPPPPPPPPPSGSPPSGCYLTGTAGGDFSASVIGYDCSFGDPPINYSFSWSYVWTDGGSNVCTASGGGGAFSIPNPSGTVSAHFTMVASNAFGNVTLGWDSGTKGVGGGVTC